MRAESTDNDSDGVCDVTDDDDDNDTVLDADEVSGCEFIADCDGDGVGQRRRLRPRSRRKRGH